MPLPFAFLTAILFGLSFAIGARGENPESGGVFRTTVLTAGFSAFVFLPVISFFVGFHGDWAYVYAVPWKKIPSAVDVVLLSLAAALIPATFRIASSAVERGRADRVLRAALPVSLLTIALAISCEKRLAVSATYVQYHAAFGVVPIGQSSLGRAVLIAWLALAAGSALWLRLVRKGHAF